MTRILGVLTYFAAGIVADLLATKWTSSVARGQRFSAATFSFVISMLQWWVLGLVVTSDRLLQGACALGGAIGCFWMMTANRRRGP